MEKVLSEIAKKNDLCRLTFDPRMVRVVITRGVAHSKNQFEIIKAVQSFDKFNEDNDPYGEHDCGSIVINGTTYFFKIDYYDDDYQYFRQDGNRVLTIMRADEY